MGRHPISLNEAQRRKAQSQSSRIAKLERELADERARCLLIVKTRHPEMYELHAMIERGCGVVCSNQVCHCDEYALRSVRAERKRNREIQELHDIRGGMFKQYWREIDDETL